MSHKQVHLLAGPQREQAPGKDGFSDLPDPSDFPEANVDEAVVVILSGTVPMGYCCDLVWSRHHCELQLTSFLLNLHSL